MLQGFQSLQEKHSMIGEVRALGLMGAIEIVKDKQTNERFESPLAPQVVNEAAKRGLILRSVVFDGQDTLVFAPPLIMTKEDITSLISILDETFTSVTKDAVKR